MNSPITPRGDESSSRICTIFKFGLDKEIASGRGVQRTAVCVVGAPRRCIRTTASNRGSLGDKDQDIWCIRVLNEVDDAIARSRIFVNEILRVHYWQILDEKHCRRKKHCRPSRARGRYGSRGLHWRICWVSSLRRDRGPCCLRFCQSRLDSLR